VGSSLVNVDDIGLVPLQVPPESRGGGRFHGATEPQPEKREAGAGAGRLEITPGTAPDPNVVSAFGEASRRRQHLDNRTGSESVLVDQVEDAELRWHGSSIGTNGTRRLWLNPISKVISSFVRNFSIGCYWRSCGFVLCHPSLPAAG
jgi:hypothetical protein